MKSGIFLFHLSSLIFDCILILKKFQVARYKGKGRLPGFHNFKLVDVDIIILGEEVQFISL